ncbi:MAG: raffinose/stachyose/melibiose transport system permease protein, partial [Microbacteriaceae bacterium]|nr:raffinose/stachyose/melibiose transport system permease protein [Microbacteriaceae bacterium]
MTISSRAAEQTPIMRPDDDRAQERSAARRRSFRRPPGYAWILPALVFSVGLLYYSVGYTGYISTLNWNGTAPDPTHVGLANYA